MCIFGDLIIENGVFDHILGRSLYEFSLSMRFKLFSITLFLLVSTSLMAVEKPVLAIDKLIFSKLQELGQAQRPGIDDATFCRRLYLDITGRIPTLQEMQGFLQDNNPNKRALLIHKLFDSKGYVSNFHNYWADLLRITYIGDKLHSMVNYSEWVKDALRKNKPYNQVVRELITAEGDLYQPGNGATGYYAREVMHLDHTASAVKAFMGMSIECAQCHDHPFEDWTQKEFYEFAAFTTNVKLRVDPSPEEEKKHYKKMRKELKDRDFDEWIVLREAARIKHAEIVGGGTGYLRLPHDYKYKDAKPHDVMQANSLFGDRPKVHYTVKTAALIKDKKKRNLGPSVNSKVAMANWLTSPDNDMFVYNIINRLWYKMMGVELIGPLENLKYGDKGPHPELTDLLAQIMKDVKFDMKQFMKIVMHTHAYQSRIRTLQDNDPRYNLDGPVLRRMSAEEIWDSMLSLRVADPEESVLDSFRYDGFTHFYEKAQNMSPVDIIKYAETSKLNRGKFYRTNDVEANKTRNGELGFEKSKRASEFRHPIRGPHLLKTFGQSTREVINGSSTEPSIPQALASLNGELEQQIIQNTSSHLYQSIKGLSPKEKIQQTYLAFLGRLPSEMEIARLGHLTPKEHQDLMWALLNSNEFKFKK